MAGLLRAPYRIFQSANRNVHFAVQPLKKLARRSQRPFSGRTKISRGPRRIAANDLGDLVLGPTLRLSAAPLREDGIKHLIPQARDSELREVAFCQSWRAELRRL
jgi:hypothetical protein